MDILLSAAVSSNVEKTSEGMLQLGWDRWEKTLRIRHVKRGMQNCCWLKLEREDAERVSRAMLNSLLNQTIIHKKWGDYEIIMDAKFSKEDNPHLRIVVYGSVDGEEKCIFAESFDSYSGDINLLEGIHEFMCIHNFKRWL